MPANEHSATMWEVLLDMKRASKGAWCARGMACAKSCELVDAVNHDLNLHTREVARRKPAESKRIAEALQKVIKSGGVFSAFMSAGECLKLSQDKDDKLINVDDERRGTNCSDEAGET